MTTPYEIPLDPTPQKFQIQIAGITYSMLTTWCGPQGSWLLDIRQADETPILLSIPLQPGTDLLAQHPHLGIPGQLWIQTDGDLDKVPGFTDLGASGHLYYVAP